MPKFNRGNVANSILTPQQVLKIRQDYASGLWTQGALARREQVSIGTIGRIVRGESWQQYPQPMHVDEMEHLEARAEAAARAPDDEVRAAEARIAEAFGLRPTGGRPPEESK